MLLVALTLILPALSFAEVRKEYYPSGKLKTEINYINGIKEGIRKTYYENGQLEVETNYKKNIKEGIYKLYYENGKLRQEGNYKNGKLDGILKMYYKKWGISYVVDTYKNGQKINRKAYHVNGKLKFDQDYPYTE